MHMLLSFTLIICGILLYYFTIACQQSVTIKFLKTRIEN